MPCLIAIIAYSFPRLVMFIMWLTGDYLGRAYQTVIWPLLGFFFMPYTTLAYAWAMNSRGKLEGIQLVVFVLAVFFDLCTHGGGGTSVARRRDR